VVECARLCNWLGIDLFLVSETFPHPGTFKFRAAYHLASRVSTDLPIAGSSGNFGQALAFALALLKKSCIVAMFDASAKVKIDAVREFGAELKIVDTRAKNRAEWVAEVARQNSGAYVASPYDDPL
jgi:threonine dehydratase